MDKPTVGQKVRIVGEQTLDTFDVGVVLETYDRIDVWWETPHGEDKVALLDALDWYGPEKAATAMWYAIVTDVDDDGSTMAVASFECESFEK